MATEADETTKAPRRGRARSRSLDRSAWVSAARKALIAGGTDQLKVELLAKSLKVTIGSFYHHFGTRDDLFNALLDDWEMSNNDPIFAAVAAAQGEGKSPLEQFKALWNEWIYDGLYDPAYDAAIRAWGRGSKAVRDRVKVIDDARIALMKRIYVDLGYDDERAFIRARVAYFHQIGYEALNVVEPMEERARLAPLYFEILLGDLSELIRSD